MGQKPLSLEEKVILQLQGKIGQLEGNLAFARAELQEFHQKNAALSQEVAKYQGQQVEPEENKEQV
jgi:FtsZ-binding cell division protein ZapB